MKTAEELARERSSKWISVEDELPKYNGKTYNIIVTYKHEIYTLYKVFSHESTWLDIIFGKSITHWIYVD